MSINTEDYAEAMSEATDLIGGICNSLSSLSYSAPDLYDIQHFDDFEADGIEYRTEDLSDMDDLDTLRDNLVSVLDDLMAERERAESASYMLDDVASSARDYEQTLADLVTEVQEARDAVNVAIEERDKPEPIKAGDIVTLCGNAKGWGGIGGRYIVRALHEESGTAWLADPNPASTDQTVGILIFAENCRKVEDSAEAA